MFSVCCSVFDIWKSAARSMETQQQECIRVAVLDNSERSKILNSFPMIADYHFACQCLKDRRNVVKQIEKNLK